MNAINEHDAPPGCIAVLPEQFADGVGSCAGCCYDSGNGNECLLDMTSSVRFYACWAEGRDDKQDIIFNKFVEDDE